jgi:hypothetical protein
MSASPTREGSANAGSSNGNLDEKPRLSEHEKKANHIASGIYLCLQPLRGLPTHLRPTNLVLKNKSVDKQSVKASTVLRSWYPAWRAKAGVKVWS